MNRHMLKQAWAKRACLPLLLLFTVAGIQMIAATQEGLTPWKGGGFGMFSSGDSPAKRQIRFFLVFQDGLRVEVLAPPELAQDVMDARVFPSGDRLTRLAEKLAMENHEKGVTHVRVEAWRTGAVGTYILFHPFRVHELAVKGPAEAGT